MVTQKSVEEQLKKIKFNYRSWGRSEANELQGVLLPDEEIHEVVNGIYEAGFAMLVATDIRILLIDKKPMNYLTVEDFRFEMINEIDYSHRLLGAHITVSTGSKTLKFTSYNQPRLRKLIGHVQHSIADGKKQQSNHAVDQKQHLEQINQQLQAYLLAQHQQQYEFQHQMSQQAGAAQQGVPAAPDPVKPSPELSDYLFAQSLLAQHKADAAKQKFNEFNGTDQIAAGQAVPQVAAAEPQPALPPVAQSSLSSANSEMADLYAEGLQEIYGKRGGQTFAAPKQAPPVAQTVPPATEQTKPARPSNAPANVLEINPLKIAYSKLPMALRNRRFGRPSFHSHAQADVPAQQPLTDS